MAIEKPSLAQWHRQEVSTPIFRDPQVMTIKQKYFQGDVHGAAAYQMHLEAQNLYDIVDFPIELGFIHATACVLGTWLDATDQVIYQDFPISFSSLEEYYGIYRTFQDEREIPVRRRLSLEDIPGIRLPLGILFEQARAIQADQWVDEEGALSYREGFDLGVKRWRELSTIG